MGTGVKVPVPYERRKLMLEFDRATKTLIAHKLPRRVKSTVYEENDMYTSYRDYLKNDLKQDIEDYVIAGLNEVKGVDIFGLGDVQGWWSLRTPQVHVRVMTLCCLCEVKVLNWSVWVQR